MIEGARKRGLSVDLRRLDSSTATAQEAAAAVGCDEAQIAKSLVFVADGDPVLCIASGSHRVDTDRLADVLDVAEVRQATPGEVRAATGFPVGGVAPFGHDLPVVVDEALLRYEHVWAAGGDSHCVFAVEAVRLVECTSATVAVLGAES